MRLSLRTPPGVNDRLSGAEGAVQKYEYRYILL